MKRNKGESFIELLVMVVIVAIIMALIFGITGGFGCGQKDSAEKQAQEWANKMYPGKNPRVSCTNADSDGDGYISCTLVIENKNGDSETIPLECAVSYSPVNTGCRVQKMSGLRNK